MSCVLPAETRLYIKLQRQDEKGDVGDHAQASQHHDDIAAGAESLSAQAIVANFTEELAVPLHASEGAHS